MTLNKGALGVLLKSRGLHMPRTKYQRPEVYRWTGQGGEKFWKAEWRQYIEGRPKPKHRAATWPCVGYTKARAQEECDRLVREETGGAPRPDGSVTAAHFWEKVYWPVEKRNGTTNTRAAYESCWRVHVEPAIGRMELQAVTKHDIDCVLGKIADAKLSRSMAERAYVIIRGIFEEALENDYIVKNPARKVRIPICKPEGETRALAEQEAVRLLSKTSGRTRLVWRVLLATGARIGEVLALGRDDLTAGVLRIDEGSTRGKAGATKNRKVRYCPVTETLCSEIEAWAAGHEFKPLFPSRTGGLLSRHGTQIASLLSESRTVAGIPDLTFRMCRTTFATLFDGDIKDVQAILGHSTLDLTVGVYRRLNQERQLASVLELEARLVGKVVPIKRAESA